MYLKIQEWEWIFGRAVKVISSPGVRSPCILSGNSNDFKEQLLLFRVNQNVIQCRVHGWVTPTNKEHDILQSLPNTSRCQVNESTRLAFFPILLALFPPYSIRKISTLLFYQAVSSRLQPYLLIWPYSFMTFPQNNHPTRLFGHTRLIGT